MFYCFLFFFFFFQAEDGIRDLTVTGVQTCALPILAVDLVALDVIGEESQEIRVPEIGIAAVGFSFRVVHGVVERNRSEEHTSELQSQSNLVCRLLLEKKKKKQHSTYNN